MGDQTLKNIKSLTFAIRFSIIENLLKNYFFFAENVMKGEKQSLVGIH